MKAKVGIERTDKRQRARPGSKFGLRMDRSLGARKSSSISILTAERCDFDSTFMSTKEDDDLINTSGNAVEKIQVFVRLRPPLYKEPSDPAEQAWEVSKEGLVNCKKGLAYQFDSVFGQVSTNQNIFSTAVRKLVEGSLKGYDGSVFCYGQTGSGKTHTMYGDNEDPGIVPRTVEYLYQLIGTATAELKYKVTLGFLEIYNESVNDLLMSSLKNLQLVEKPKGVISIRGLTECVCETEEDAMAVLKLGEKTRHIGITQNNEKSSRSHTILRISIESRTNDPAKASGYSATLNLVDLAGSECANTHVANNKSGKLETGCINKSLLVLGTIIQRLSESKRSDWIPYRDSKLTRYMQKALEGHSKISIITTVSPWRGCYDESMNTICFATRAKKVTQVVQRNKLQTQIDPAVKQAYETRISELQQRIEQMEQLYERPLFDPVQDVSLLPLSPTGTEENEVLKTRLAMMGRELSRVSREKELLRQEIERIRETRHEKDVTKEMEERLRESLVEDEQSIIETVELSREECEEDLLENVEVVSQHMNDTLVSTVKKIVAEVKRQKENLEGEKKLIGEENARIASEVQKKNEELAGVYRRIELYKQKAMGNIPKIQM